MPEPTSAPTARILVPGAYLDAYRADPHPDAPAALHNMLTDATTTGEGTGRRATLDVPLKWLPDLAAITDDHFRTWGADYTRRRTTLPREEAEALAQSARMAFHTYQQAARHLRNQERPA